jgi:hypothetical protein
MDVFELEILLEDTKYKCFIDNIHRIELKGFVYNDIYKIGNNELGYYALKIRSITQKHLFDSIDCLKIINDSDDMVNKNTDIIEKEPYIIMVSNWIDGTQPIDTNRKQLPEFFSRIAFFFFFYIVKRPYTSMYADGNYFDSIKDVVDWEINYHKDFLCEMLTKETIEVLNNLKHGLNCIIMEEINTGNLLITHDGRYKIIDTEWMHRGLNLHQFDHFNYFGFDDKTWYNITEEAEDCYRAYFDSLKIKNEEANEQIRAIELLSVLRQNTFLEVGGKENDGLKEKIKIVMEKEKYI